MLDLTSFNLLFVCFSYFIQNVFEDYDDSCSYCRQWRNSIRNCHWQLFDWLKTQVRLQFKFFSIKMVYNFYVLLDWTLGQGLPVYNFVKKWKLRKIFSLFFNFVDAMQLMCLTMQLIFTIKSMKMLGLGELTSERRIL